MKAIPLLVIAIGITVGLLPSISMANDNVDAVNFVNEATIKGIELIEASKLALQKSTSADIKTFAQQIIDERTAANKELATIATKKNLKVATDAELSNKAKAFMFRQSEGEPFDEAYVKNQVKTHQEAVDLFNQAAVSKDVDLAGFATENLPKLKHHLTFAEQMVNTFKKNN